MKRNQQILQRKKASLPINYRYLRVDESGNLTDKESLLDKRIVSGYAVMWSSINDYEERFVKGCFAKSIKENGPASNANYKIKFLDQHGKPCSLLAEIVEDEIGLYFKSVPLDNVRWADDLLVQLKSGTINNFSIGFRHIWDKVEWDEENDCLVVIEARLFEISAVTIPADMETFAFRSLNEEPEYLEDETEEFISSLPKSKQLECRKLIARHISLASKTPPPTRSAARKQNTKKNKGLRLDYITKNLNL